MGEVCTLVLFIERCLWYSFEIMYTGDFNASIRNSRHLQTDSSSHIPALASSLS